MSLIKKIAILISLTLLPLLSSANSNLNIVIPLNEGGSAAASSKIIAEHLEDFGYSVNRIIAGDCINAERIYKNLEDPTVVLWVNAFFSTNQPCNAPKPSENNVMNVIFYAPAYVCTNPNITDGLNSKKKIVMGFHEEMPTSIQDAFTNYNSNITLIPYVNSGAIGTALVSGEIDGTISDQGLYFESNGLVECDYIMHHTATENQKSVSETTGVDNMDYSLVVYTFTNNMNSAERKQLNDAITRAFNENSELIDLFENRSLSIDIQTLSLGTQLEFIKGTIE